MVEIDVGDNEKLSPYIEFIERFHEKNCISCEEEPTCHKRGVSLTAIKACQDYGRYNRKMTL